METQFLNGFTPFGIEHEIVGLVWGLLLFSFLDLIPSCHFYIHSHHCPLPLHLQTTRNSIWTLFMHYSPNPHLLQLWLFIHHLWPSLKVSALYSSVSGRLLSLAGTQTSSLYSVAMLSMSISAPAPLCSMHLCLRETKQCLSFSYPCAYSSVWY